MTFPVRKWALLAVLGALALALVSCGGGDEKAAEDVPSDAIALIGDTEVPRAEFDELMKRAERSYETQNRPFPKAGTPEYKDLKDRAVAFLLQRYQFRAEAEELDVEVTDADVDKKLEEITKEGFGGDEKKLLQALEREGLTMEEARAEIRDNLIRERLYEKVTEDVEVSDEEVERYYEKNKAQFTQPESRDVRHILVQQKARADDLYAQLQDGASFASLAREFSQDTSTKRQGGKLPVTKGGTVPPFDKTAFALETGEVSRPVKTQFGWHIIEALTPVKRANARPIGQVKDSIQQRLVDEKRSKAVEKWLEGVERKYEPDTVYAAGFQAPKTAADTANATTSKE